jgi:hypothetical protein
MSHMRAFACLPVLAAAAVLASGAGAQAPIHCQAKSIGPGSLQRGGIAGAACLLAAFDHGCRSASYTLSQFGVDTVHSLKFDTLRLPGGTCGVAVLETFRVVPQPPRLGDSHTCGRLRKTAAGDIVADRCKPDSATISLTKPAG